MSFNPNSVLLAKDKLLFHLVFLSHTFSTDSKILLAKHPSPPVSSRSHTEPFCVTLLGLNPQTCVITCPKVRAEAKS